MARFADDVLLMDQGQVIVQGPFATVVDEDHLSSIYRRPIVFGQLKGRRRPFIVVE